MSDAAQARTWNQAANLVLLALFWAVFYLQLSYEWSISEQYSYGLFVPFIGAYLFSLRWQERPPGRKDAGSPWAALILLVLIIALHYPVKIIFEANADWRLLIWTQAAMVMAASLILLYRWGGRPWLLHFAWVLVFLLTAVPWPRWVEAWLVDTLMRYVAIATVELVNVIGIYAHRTGNIIHLSNGMVSVEEACSGIRSFQSSLMAAVFLGELFRFRNPYRILLIVLGGLMAVFFNFCRTLALTIVSARRGSEAMESWHDPAGYAVFGASFAALLIVSLIFRKLKARAPVKETPPPEGTTAWLGKGASLSLSVLLLLTLPATFLWYQMRGPERVKAEWSVIWENGANEVVYEDILPRVQDVLCFDVGEMVRWNDPQQRQWLAYYFEWDKGRSAQLGGFHNPEICLPATGWELTEKADDLVWHDPVTGLELIFNCYRFVSFNDQTIYVFYCQWDPAGYPYHKKMGRYRMDRLVDAWHGDRKEGKQKLEIILAGAESMQEAQIALVELLNRTIQAEPVPAT